jgi:predicted alpha/beta-hydrolase family hydrolase
MRPAERSRRGPPEVVEVPTPGGPARVHRYPAADAWATLFLGHGAGGGLEAADLKVLALALPSTGIEVCAVEQPWRVAGRRAADRPARLDQAWCSVIAASDRRPGRPLLLGGRSAGARVACRTAERLGAAGVLALAFPLHPPGRPAASRAHELAVGCPLLVVQGERDPFGRPEEFPATVPVAVVPAADHGFAVPRSGPVTRPEALECLLREVLRWLRPLRQGAGGAEPGNGPVG